GRPMASNSRSHSAVVFWQRLVEDRLELGVVLRAQARGVEARVADQVRAADGRAEQLPLVLDAPRERDYNPAVLRRERLERRREGMACADRPRDVACREIAGEGVLQDRDLAIEHTYVEHLAPTAALAFLERREYTDRGVQTR